MLVLFYFFIFLAVSFITLIFFSFNTIFSLFSLICVTLCTTCLLLLMGVEFLALIYTLVYIGAVAIFFIFVVMLVNLRKEDSWEYFDIPYLEKEFGFVTWFTTLVIFYYYIYWEFGFMDSLCAKVVLTDKVWTRVHSLETFGYHLYTQYSFLIIIIALLLLVGMVGAVALARLHVKKK